MACGCGKRSRALANGQEIAGYRVVLEDGTTIPEPPAPPFLSAAEARTEIRLQGGGTAYTEYRSVAQAG